MVLSNYDISTASWSGLQRVNNLPKVASQLEIEPRPLYHNIIRNSTSARFPSVEVIVVVNKLDT